MKMRARRQMEAPIDENRRQLLKGMALAGTAGAAAAVIPGFLAGRASAAPGDAISGSSITGTDIDAKRISAVRMASEFAPAKHAGTTVDPWPTSAIIDAIADLPATGGIVMVSPGYWDGRFDITKADVQIIGHGIGATIIRPLVSQTNYVIGIEANGVRLRDLTIDGITTNGIGIRGSSTNGVRRLRVETCEIKNCVDFGVNLLGSTAGTEDQDCDFIRCYIHDITASAQYEGGIVTGGTEFHRRINVLGCRFENINSAAVGGNEAGVCVGIDINEGAIIGNFARNCNVFYLTGMQNTLVEDNVLYSQSGGGFLIDLDANSINNTVVGNIILHASGTAANLIRCQGTRNNVVGNTIRATAGLFNAMILMEGSDHIVEGNTLEGVSDIAGISVTAVRSLVKGNRIRVRQADAGNFPPGIDVSGAYNSIEGNYIYDSEAGIAVTNVEMCKVDGNVLHTIRRHGINLNGGTRCSVRGNHLYGVSQETNNTYHDIFAQGTATRNIIAENVIFENLANKANTGLKEAAAADDFNRWSNNRINGPVTANIALLGAASVNDANDVN